MKADYKIGVCFSNDDPSNLGRIRAIPVDILGKASTLRDIQLYIEKEDQKAITTLSYRPWYSVKNGNFTQRDKYVCEPFLPRNIGLTPNPGQLVKIINYDDLNQKIEFIGPYTIDQVTLNEDYRNVVNNLQKNLNLNEALPKKGKTFLSGYTNEQIILGDNEFLIRLAHINPINKTRKNSYPFIQLSQFQNSYVIKEKTTTFTETPDLAIDYICELFLSYIPKASPSDKNFTAELILYDASKLINTQNLLGLTRNTYNPNNEYTTVNTSSYVVRHFISTSNFNELSKIIEEILIGYKTGGIVKYFDASNTTTQQRTENTITTIVVNNNVPVTPNPGGATNPNNIVFGIKNWLFRLNPPTKITNYQGTLVRPNVPPGNIEDLRYNDYRNLDSLITRYSTEKKYGGLATNNTRTTTITAPMAQSAETPQSVHTIYSDKFLFLSSLNSLNLIDNLNFDGIPANKIAEYLSGTNPNVRTYGFVRGERLMELLNEILDMFLRHGHEAGKDPRASIVQSTQEAVENIKKKIKDELKEGQNNVILNHNFRLN
jgi:hypothetical protein